MWGCGLNNPNQTRLILLGPTLNGICSSGLLWFCRHPGWELSCQNCFLEGLIIWCPVLWANHASHGVTQCWGDPMGGMARFRKRGLLYNFVSFVCFHYHINKMFQLLLNLHVFCRWDNWHTWCKREGDVMWVRQCFCSPEEGWVTVRIIRSLWKIWINKGDKGGSDG